MNSIMGLQKPLDSTKAQLGGEGNTGQFVDKITRLLFQNQNGSQVNGSKPVGFRNNMGGGMPNSIQHNPAMRISSAYQNGLPPHQAHGHHSSGLNPAWQQLGPRVSNTGALMGISQPNPISFSFNSDAAGVSSNNANMGSLTTHAAALPNPNQYYNSHSHRLPPAQRTQSPVTSVVSDAIVPTARPPPLQKMEENGAPTPAPIVKASFANGGPYGGAKRGAGTRKRKRVVPRVDGGARAVRVPADADFAIGLDRPIVECLREGGRKLNSLEMQKLKDATSLLQEMQLHILEPLTLYTPAELYDLMASIAETWKNSGKAAWKKRINKIKENARGRKAPRNQLDPAEINEINQLNERIRIRENWEKKEKEKIDLEKRLQKRADQQNAGKKAKKESKGKKGRKPTKAASKQQTLKKIPSNDAKLNKPTSAGKPKNEKLALAKEKDFVPNVADIASLLARK